MCNTVYFDDGTTFPAWEAETQCELSRRLGGELVKASTHNDCVLNPDDCLCPIDLRATAEKFGLEYRLDDELFEHIFSVPNAKVSGTP